MAPIEFATIEVADTTAADRFYNAAFGLGIAPQRPKIGSSTHSRSISGADTDRVGRNLMTDRKRDDQGPKLLSGGNPQIPKGEGDGPVQDYIAAMPGWKRAVGERLDDLIVRTVPEVHKAVKWNQPFYGLKGEGWFLSFRCYTNYVQLQFFRGTSLDPMPPKASKHDEVRYLDIREDDELKEDQLRAWIEQASHLPGETM